MHPLSIERFKLLYFNYFAVKLTKSCKRQFANSFFFIYIYIYNVSQWVLVSTFFTYFICVSYEK